MSRAIRAQAVAEAQDLISKTEDRLASFAVKDKDGVADVDAYTILGRIVRLDHESDLTALLKQHVGESGKKLSPYIFDHTTSSIAIERKKKPKSKKAAPEELEELEEEAEPKPGLNADMLLGPLDLALHSSIKVPTLCGLAHKQLSLANIFLASPLEVDAEYLKRLVATTIRETKEIEAIFEKRAQVIGSFASLLCGIDVLEILRIKHEVYNGHVQAFRGLTKSGLPTEGFSVFVYLPLRIFFTLNTLVNIQLGLVANANLGSKLLEKYKGDAIAVREHRVNELMKELWRDLQSYWFARYSHYAGTTSAKADEREALIKNLISGLTASIKKLAVGDSSVLSLVWGGTNTIGHAFYLRIHRVSDDKWNLLIHNLGQGNELHQPPRKDRGSPPRCRPFRLGKLSSLAWEDDQAGYAYLKSTLESMLALTIMKNAKPIFYGKGEHKLLEGKPGVEPIPNDEDYGLHQEQGATGNCVYAAHESARSGCFKDYLSLAREEDKIASEVNRYRDTPEAFKVDKKLWMVFAKSPAKEIPRPDDSNKRIKSLIDKVADILNASYLRDYENIPTLWKEKEWDEPTLSMEKFYLDLKLVQRNSEGKIGDGDPIDLAKLVDEGKSLWIVGQLGSGKSTLMQKIAFDYASKKLGSRYRQVILFPLRKLKTETPPGLSLEEKISYYLGDIHLNEKFDKEQCAYFARQLFDPDVKEQTLWLLDGYDEVALALDEAQAQVLAHLKGQGHVLISVRPEGHPSDESTKTHIVIKGLENEQIKKWIFDYAEHNAKQSGAKDLEASAKASADEIYKFLHGDARVWELVHSPINLKLACMAFTRGYLGADVTIETPTQLYNALCTMLAERHYERQGSKDLSAASYWEELEEGLSNIAISALDEAKLEIAPTLTTKVIGELSIKNYRRNWILEIIESGVIRKMGSVSNPGLTPVEFLHASFQQYFAAKAVIKRMESQSEAEFKLWFAQHKFDVLYQAVWRFVSGLLPSAALTDQWVKLWLQPPYRMDSHDNGYTLFGLISDTLLENPFSEELRCRDQFATHITKARGSSITELPKGIIKIMQSLSLWEHAHAEAWINSLIKCAQDDSDLDRANKARNLLAEVKGVSEKLKTFLTDKESKIRYMTAIALAKLKQEIAAVIPLLIDCLEKSEAKDINLLMSVSEAIEEIETPDNKIVAALVTALDRFSLTGGNNQPNIRLYLVKALVKQKPTNPETTELRKNSLLKHLKSVESSTITDLAIRGLLQEPPVGIDVIEKIAECLIDPLREEIRKKAEASLKDLLVKQADALDPIAKFLLDKLKDTVFKVDTPVFVIDAIVALNIKTPAIIDELSKKAEARNFSAVEALGQLKADDARVITLLISIATTASSRDLRSKAIDALGDINKPTPEQIAALLPYLNGADSKLHERACKTFGDMKLVKDELEKALIASLQKTGSLASTYQRPAIAALARIGKFNADKLSLVELLLKCPPSDLDTKNSIIRILSKLYLQDPATRELLFKKMQKSESAKEESEHVQSIIIRVLLEHKTEDIRIRPLLVDKLNSAIPSIRFSALQALVGLNFSGNKVIDRLISLIKSDKETLQWRLWAINALSEFKAKEAKDALISLLEDRQCAAEAALALLKISHAHKIALEPKVSSRLADPLREKLDHIIFQNDNQCIVSIQGIHYPIEGATKVAAWTKAFAGAKAAKRLCEAMTRSFADSVASVMEPVAADKTAASPAVGSKRIRAAVVAGDSSDTAGSLSHESSSTAASAQGLFSPPAHKRAKPGALEIDPWYDDNKMNILIGQYCRDAAIVPLLSLPFDDANDVEADLIRARFLIEMRADTTRYFLPLRIHGNHWIGLWVDMQPGNPVVYWLDPFGSPPAYKEKLIAILNDTGFFDTVITNAHIRTQVAALQEAGDGINCGPYVIEMLRYLHAHNSLPPAGSINPIAARAEHEAVIAALQAPIVLDGAEEEGEEEAEMMSASSAARGPS